MKKIIFFSFIIILMTFFSTALSEDKNMWELTQYADASGNQAMFYSLVNRESNSLILIDGGWSQNADQVSKVIEENGGHVTAWFLTHYHNDHCDAFNTLWGNYKDQIDVVYCTPLIWEDFEPTAQAWDSPETFKTFLSITDGEEKVVRLYRGDELEVAGLKIQVFNAYDDMIIKHGDIANNCSLMFKVSASRQSVLFTGDVWRKGLGMEILEMYGAEAMQADYVQAGHHGNNTLSFEFYKAVNPSVIFLDGPEWLMTGESYDAKDLLAWCAENGIQTYDYRQAPTTLILK